MPKIILTFTLLLKLLTTYFRFGGWRYFLFVLTNPNPGYMPKEMIADGHFGASLTYRPITSTLYVNFFPIKCSFVVCVCCHVLLLLLLLRVFCHKASMFCTYVERMM